MSMTGYGTDLYGQMIGQSLSVRKSSYSQVLGFSLDTIIAGGQTAVSGASCWFGARSLYAAGALTFICRQRVLKMGPPIRRSVTAGHVQHRTAHSPTCALVDKLA